MPINVDDPLTEKIIPLCQQIEIDENIKILFAVEVGNLIYGFSSEDKTRDIRFVYFYPFHYPYEKYISFRTHQMTYEKKFVLNVEETKGKQSKVMLDTIGWHIYKYAEFLAKSNPMTIEWLFSPNIYYGNISNELQLYARKNYRPIVLFHYYYNICKTHYNRLQQLNEVQPKKYLYPLMGAFKASFVLKNKKIPPISIQETMKEISDIIPNFIIEKCHEIIIQKQKEKESEGRIAIIDYFLKEFISNLARAFDENHESKLEIKYADLDEIVRSIILLDSHENYPH